MIKRFLSEIQNHALRAMFGYIDDKLDELDERVDRLEKSDRKVTDELSKVMAVVESGSETRKTVKKTIVTAVITGIVGYLLSQYGLK
ncbi:hypothetical protein [Mammaliicoccus sciuri]|uniref:hypothetical protein n=1 Tax=Mammaliicoccus sciuri TaxID=1296 RepID=UPI000D1E1D18|nr:hypothetical protein [Mammaliicoccus sciuri]PTJ54176.1 hypothetical protein BU012_00850 [Mammaliicoccus sciuri]